MTVKKEQGMLARQADLIGAGLVVGMMFVLLVPLPARVLDCALVLNLALALAALLLVSSAKRVLELSSFPSALLVLALLRLSLNVASTRAILTHGEAFEGVVIRCLGQFMVGNSLAIGFVVFLILLAIQFLVISRGSERVAEVAARFRLDAMPLKMMAVQQQLEGGQITAAEAERRMSEIQREADLYGAMDGAARFVKGETMASALIFGVNLMAGVYLGLQAGIADLWPVISSYALLTVGDGLVTLIPSILVSFAMGLLITKSSSDGSVVSEAVEQFCARPRPLAAVAAILSLMLASIAFGSGAGKLPFLAAAVLLGLAAWKGFGSVSVEVDTRESAESELRYGARWLNLRVGRDVRAALGEDIGRLLLELERVRHQIRQELGLPVPPIGVSEDATLPASGYSLELRGQPIAQSRGSDPDDVPGDPLASRLAAFVAKKIRLNADELLGRQELDDLLAEVRRTMPAVHDAVAAIDRNAVLAVFRGLLAEKVSIGDTVAILDAIANHRELASTPGQLTESVRWALSRQLCRGLDREAGSVPIMTLPEELEQELAASYVPQDDFLALHPDRVRTLLGVVTDGYYALEGAGHRPVLLTTPALRRHVRALVGPYLPELLVLSRREIWRETPARFVRLDVALAPALSATN